MARAVKLLKLFYKAQYITQRVSHYCKQHEAPQTTELLTMGWYWKPVMTQYIKNIDISFKTSIYRIASSKKILNFFDISQYLLHIKTFLIYHNIFTPNVHMFISFLLYFTTAFPK